MARFNPHFPNAERLLRAAEQWRDRCLIDEGSLFSEASLWRPDLISEVRHAFVDNPLLTDESFMDKLRQQFADVSRSGVQLLAEIYWILNLFPSNMGGGLKSRQVREIWSWSGETLPEDHPFLDTEMLAGIGSGGMGFLAHRWRELRYLMNLLAAWCERSDSDRRDMLQDPWRFAEWMESIPDEGYRQLRHVLPFLLFPDTFERIASPTHIERILEKVGGMDTAEVARMTKVERDKALLALRERLEAEKGSSIDFYEGELEGRWREKGDAVLTVEEADGMLARSLERTNTTDKVASFETPAGTPVALDLKSKTVQVWTSPSVPQIDGVSLKRHYAVGESRSSNLPAGLQKSREALLLNVSTQAGLEDLLDALRGQGHGPLDESAFERMVGKFLSHMPDFSTFDAKTGRYFESERDYKEEFFEVFAARAGPHLVNPVVDENDAVRVLEAVHTAMTAPLERSKGPQNMIGWRSLDHLRRLRGDPAITVAQAMQRLWRGDAPPEVLVGEVAGDWVATLEANGVQSAKGIVRALGSMLLAIRRPSAAVFIRSNLWQTASRQLLGTPIFANRPITAEEYRRALALSRELFRRFEQREWRPRDFWDVHNFLWVACEYDSYVPIPGESGPGEAPEESGPYVPPVDPEDVEGIADAIADAGLLYERDLIVRYHVGLRVRNFVILAGDSGTGKTALARAYARTIDAALHVEPVAPNWTSNEDLLGFLSPIDDAYRHTNASRFLDRAAKEFESALAEGRQPRPFHLLLDEMNLARVEYYFARFLSAMERRDEEGAFEVELAPGRRLRLGPNLFVIGTVNIDETTHGFAEKVYDRAQLIEVEPSETLIAERLEGTPYADLLLALWRSGRGVAPFSFRTLDDLTMYVNAGTLTGLDWRSCVDHQLRQKVLPKVRGADPRLAGFLDSCIQLATEFDLPLTRAKAEAMAEQLRTHGYASYF